MEIFSIFFFVAILVVPALITYLITASLKGIARRIVLAIACSLPVLLILYTLSPLYPHYDPETSPSPDAGGFLVLGIWLLAVVVLFSAIVGMVVAAMVGYKKSRKERLQTES